MDDNIPLLKHGPAAAVNIINRIIKQLRRQRVRAGENLAIVSVSENGTLLRAEMPSNASPVFAQGELPEPPSNGPLRWVAVKMITGEPPSCTEVYRWFLASAAFAGPPIVEEAPLEDVGEEE